MLAERAVERPAIDRGALTATPLNGDKPGQRAISVYVIVDFEPLREGLIRSISNAPDMEVAGYAPTLETMLQDGAFPEANVLVVDMQTLNLSDRESIYRRLVEWVPAMKVLFLGSPQEAQGIDFESVPQAMSLHTIGLLLKNGSGERVMEAIRLIASGVFVCEAEVIRHMLTRLTQWASYEPETNSKNGLSDRETEVLRLVAEGCSNKEIAHTLFLSEGTVKAHISHIMNKLGVDRRTELVKYALAKGIISVTDE
jgi:DNA-binding NarL/FixJ family response regulator